MTDYVGSPMRVALHRLQVSTRICRPRHVRKLASTVSGNRYPGEALAHTQQLFINNCPGNPPMFANLSGSQLVVRDRVFYGTERFASEKARPLFRP
jgi:hypothetical protein